MSAKGEHLERLISDWEVQIQKDRRKARSLTQNADAIELCVAELKHALYKEAQKDLATTYSNEG